MNEQTRKSWQKCSIHGEINADHQWGCPDCVSELRRENASLHAALIGILELGRQDRTNPKFDSYFDTAKRVIQAYGNR